MTNRTSGIFAQNTADRYPIDYRSADFLLRQIRDTLAFYEPRAFDSGGGFFHCFMNNGEVFNPGLKTLVASCRFVVNYARAFVRFGERAYLDYVKHGLQYLRNAHRDAESGGYAWRIEDGVAVDRTNHCYGLAFVMLAYACALKAGVREAREWLYETFDVMERRFWSTEFSLYACEASADWTLSDYRGQNDNMHACEAMIAAYEATGDSLFLDRACLVADNMTQRQSLATQGHVWEHYRADWTPDLDYNRNDTTNSLRPWGVQTGHQTEWAKLLIMLDRHRPETWRVKRARELFDRALNYGWDEEYGGLIYGYDLHGKPCDQDKYFWVQAESLAAAALLADRTGEEAYWECYDRIWDYSFRYFVDHIYGAWYRLLRQDNTRYDERKSYNNKADYHTMGACHDVLDLVTGRASRPVPVNQVPATSFL